jgi:hypothetical protein
MENLQVQRKKMSLANIEGKLTIEEMENVMAGSCTGNNVLGCFLDVYSGHGWASLAAGLTTGFYPITGVVFAAACAAKNGC